MSYRFRLYSTWSSSGNPVKNPIAPTAGMTSGTFAFAAERQDLLTWLDEVIAGRWWFEAELTAYEYDTGQTEHTVYIFYEEPRDAFLHRMRW